MQNTQDWKRSILNYKIEDNRFQLKSDSSMGF